MRSAVGQYDDRHDDSSECRRRRERYRDEDPNGLTHPSLRGTFCYRGGVKISASLNDRGYLCGANQRERRWFRDADGIALDVPPRLGCNATVREHAWRAKWW